MNKIDYELDKIEYDCRCLRCTIQYVDKAVKEQPPDLLKAQALIFNFPFKTQSKFWDESILNKLKKLDEFLQKRDFNEIHSLIDELVYTSDYQTERASADEASAIMVMKGKHDFKKVKKGKTEETFKLIKRGKNEKSNKT